MALTPFNPFIVRASISNQDILLVAAAAVEHAVCAQVNPQILKDLEIDESDVTIKAAIYSDTDVLLSDEVTLVNGNDENESWYFGHVNLPSTLTGSYPQAKLKVWVSDSIAADDNKSGEKIKTSAIPPFYLAVKITDHA